MQKRHSWHIENKISSLINFKGSLFATGNESNKYYKAQNYHKLPYIHFQDNVNMTIVVFVVSRINNSEARKIIRQTYANTSHYREYESLQIIVIFALGLTLDTKIDRLNNSQLENELRANADILLLNMHDTYKNLTLKGLLTMSWIYHNIPQAQYIYKMDDDVMINMFQWINVTKMLEKKSLPNGAIICRTTKLHKIYLETYSLNVTVNNKQLSQCYCSGPGYLMTRKALQNIVIGYNHQTLIKTEDVYFTGLVRLRMDIPIYSIASYTYKFGHDPANTLLLHGVPNSDKKRIWSQFYPPKNAYRKLVRDL